MIVFAAPCGMSQQDPVSGPITGSAKPAGIDEGFGEVNRMAVHPFPVAAQGAGHLPQKMRGQVRNPNPWQDQEPRVVGEEANVPPPRLRVPADVAVAAAQMPRSRTPRQTGDGTSLCPGQILQVLADGLLVTQVVIVLHQAVE